MGVARGVLIDLSIPDFVDSVYLPPSCGEVLKARKLNRKQTTDGVVTWVPTQSVVITYRGQNLPSYICSFHASLPIEMCKLPTIQCLNCCRFGQVKINAVLSQDVLNAHNLIPVIHVTSQKIALNVYYAQVITQQQTKFAHSRHEHSRQRSIKLVMSQENISYLEASSRFAPSYRSYADITKILITPPLYSPTATVNYTQSNTSPSVSYRKTVTRNPRPQPPLARGYDIQFHKSLTHNHPSSNGNGCALNETYNSNKNDNYTLSPDDNLIISIGESFLNMIKKFNDIPLPSNVAKLLSQLSALHTNGSNSNNSMEL